MTVGIAKQKQHVWVGEILPFIQLERNQRPEPPPSFLGSSPPLLLPPVLKFYQEVGSTMVSRVRLIWCRDAEITVAKGGQEKEGGREQTRRRKIEEKNSKQQKKSKGNEWSAKSRGPLMMAVVFCPTCSMDTRRAWCESSGRRWRQHDMRTGLEHNSNPLTY